MGAMILAIGAPCWRVLLEKPPAHGIDCGMWGDWSLMRRPDASAPAPFALVSVLAIADASIGNCRAGVSAGILWH
jgi:hypothetical protein